MVVKKKKPKTKLVEEEDDSGGNFANDLVCDTEKEEEILEETNTIQDVIKEIGRALFEKYNKKTSNLTSENADGITQAESLNEYMERGFGFRYKVLDTLVASKRANTLSVNAYGIAAFIESIKSVQTSIEQHQIPEQLKRVIR